MTHILFELCLVRYPAQSTYFRDTLYIPITYNYIRIYCPQAGAGGQISKNLVVGNMVQYAKYVLENCGEYLQIKFENMVK